MRSSCKILGFLLLLVVFTWPTKTGAQWATGRDAEEEEEEDLNIVAGNESFRSTLPPVEKASFGNESSTWKSESSEDDDASWLSDTNVTEQEDPLKTVNNKEPSLENGVERDSDEDMHSSLFVDVRNSEFLVKLHSIYPSPSFSVTYTPSFSVSPPISDIEFSSASISEFTCDFGDRKCDPQRSVPFDELPSKFKDNVFNPSTVITTIYHSPTSPVWNIVKQMRSLGQPFSFETQPVSETQSITLSIFTTQSSTAQTSENLILVEGAVEGKDETLVQGNLTVKSEKTKHAKFPETYDHNVDERPSRTFSKIEVTSVMSEFEKFSTTTSTLNSPLESSSDLSISTFSMSADLAFSSNENETEVPFFIIDVTPTEEVVQQNNETKVSESISPSDVINSHAINRTINIIYSSSTPYVYSFSTSVETISEVREVETILDSTPHLFPSFSRTHAAVETMVSESPSVTSTVDRHGFVTSTTLDVLLDTPSSSTIESQINSSFLGEVSTGAHTTFKEEESVPPPRLTNPGCSSLPVCVDVTLLETTWEEFCPQTYEFQEFLSTTVSHYTRPIHPHQIALDALPCISSHPVRPEKVSIAFYVTDESGEYEERLTEICGVILRKWAPTAFRNAVLEVRLFTKEELPVAYPVLPEVNSGFVAAVTISAVAGVALCLLCILLVVMKQKLLQNRNPPARASAGDAYSLDSLSINASFRRRRARRSARSYLNHAFNDQEFASHPLNEKTLVNCLKNKELLEDEFKKIPMNMPKLDQIPEGADVKNRYSNILPKPESRVVLAEPSGDPLKSYINANYIKGYEGKAAYYIACQAPLPEGIEDFWRMVWEQQSRVIVMLTMFEENGVSRCATYFPQSTLVSHPPYGDFQISLLKKDVYEFYTMSTFRLFDLERNLFREITHFWYTAWPAIGVPKDTSSLVTFLLQCRPFINCNSGPTVVHCSTGTGRTGIFLTLDICMREYEDSRSVDVLQCVTQLRRDRGGAVQNKDQYVLIYEAMQEYSSRIANQSQRPSIRSNN